MRLGFVSPEFANQARRRGLQSSGRPRPNTNGRPPQFFPRRDVPPVDHTDPLGWFIPRSRELGFDAIEGSIEPYVGDARALDRIGNLLAIHDIAIAGDWFDEFQRPVRPFAEFTAYVDAAVSLGVKAIGIGGMPFSINRFSDDPSLDRAMAMYRENLVPKVEYAERVGVRLAIENHADYRVKDLMEYVVRPINSPALGIKLDTGNAPLVIEDAVDAADACAEVCYATHFKDMFVSPVTPDGGRIVGAPLGRGHCRLAQVAAILASRSPFTGDLILAIEIGWIAPNEDYFEWLAESVAWCRTTLAPLLEPFPALVQGGS